MWGAKRKSLRIEEVAVEAQSAILDATSSLSEAERCARGLDQAGLTDGASHVRAYLEGGELALALEHVLYMVRETSIPLSEASRKDVRELAAALGLAEASRASSRCAPPPDVPRAPRPELNGRHRQPLAPVEQPGCTDLDRLCSDEQSEGKR